MEFSIQLKDVLRRAEQSARQERHPCIWVWDVYRAIREKPFTESIPHPPYFIDETEPMHNAAHTDGFYCKYCGEQVAYGAYIDEEECGYKEYPQKGFGVKH